MSKKKAKKNAEQGTYAICMTAGLFLGFGLGPILGSVLISAPIGLVVGWAAGYLINHRKPAAKK
ncbi:MAG: hypothetical protein DHS20C12_09740 [Pseudohongiella sp.]|nr:MAG: hypothetical protein DHS20C12_09740 [Pseudohongiella sp.]